MQQHPGRGMQTGMQMLQRSVLAREQKKKNPKLLNLMLLPVYLRFLQAYFSTVLCFFPTVSQESITDLRYLNLDVLLVKQTRLND